jgi:predicted ATPase
VATLAISEMRVRFSDFDLDAARREARRGDERLTIEPRVFDLIVYLIRHRDRMVPKSELLDELWPGQDVQEGALSVCVHRARKLVEDGGRRAILTVARRGYRFIAPVEVLGGEGGDRAQERLVGRTAELGIVRDAVDAALDYRSPTIELVGEAGIGKTTLLDEIGSYARRRGMDVLRASASLHTDSNAFSLWAQTIGAYAAQRDGQVARRVLGSHAATLGRMVPVLRRWATPGQATDVLRQTRMKLFDAVAQVVRSAAAEQPLALLLDDLHWADTDSLVVLRFVLATCTRLPLLVVVAYRDEGAQSQAIAGLRHDLDKRAANHHRLELSRFTERQVQSMLEQLAGGAVPDSASRAATRATGGNPLWVEEWWRSALDSGSVSKQRAQWVAHGSVAEVRVRFGPEAPALQAASASCRRVLEVISLLEAEATPDLVQEVSAASDADFAAAVAEAEQLELLAPSMEAGRLLYFQHPAIQEEFYHQMDEANRARLHQRAGEVLERRHADSIDEQAGLLARHFLAGIDASSAGRAIRYAEEAGHQAFAALAFDRAATFFDHALEASERFRPDESVRMWPSYMMLAESYLQAGEEERARRAYRDRVLALGGGRLARATDDASGEPVTPIGITRLLANIQVALRLPGTTAHADAHILQRARQAALDAVRNAEERAEAGPLTHALIGQRWLEFVLELQPDQLARSSEALRLATTLGSTDLQQEARLLRIHDLLVAARVDEADAEIAEYGAIATATAEPAYRWVYLYLTAMRAHLAGRLDEAERRAEQALTLGTAHFGEVAGVVYWSQVSSIRSQQGRFAEVLPWLETLIVRFPHIAVVQAMLCRAWCDLGRYDEVRALLPDLVVSVLEPDSTQRSSWLRAALTLARVFTHLGDREHAAALLERLEPYADRFIVFPVAVACGGPVSAILAPLAATAGLEARACELFERSIDTLESIGAAALLANVRERHARFLDARQVAAGARSSRGEGIASRSQTPSRTARTK